MAKMGRSQPDDPKSDAELRQLGVEARKWILRANSWLRPEVGPVDHAAALRNIEFAISQLDSIREDLKLLIERTAN